MNILSALLVLTLVTTPGYMIRLTIGGIPFYLPELFIIAAFLVWLILLIQKKLALRFPSWPIVASVVLFTLGAVIAAAQDPTVTLGALKSWVVLPAVFGWLVFQGVSANEQIRHHLKNGLAVIALVVSLWGIVQVIQHGGRLESFFNSPNSAAMWLVPTFFILLASFRQGWKLICPALILVAILLTKSFGAVMALVGSGILLVVALRARSVTARRLTWVGSVVGMLLFATLSWSRYLLSAMDQLFGTRLGGRLQIWQVAQTAIGTHRLTGIGPGRFESYYFSIVGMTFPNPIEWSVPQPHNLYLATWLASGLIGVVGFIGMVLSLGYYQIKNRQPYLLAALSAILIHGLVDTTYWKNDLSIIFFLIVGLVAAKEASARPANLSPGK